jgi:serine acetyltransferase
MIRNKIQLFLCNHIPSKFIFNRRITFSHPLGVVIGRSVKIGNDVIIGSNVTIGGKIDKSDTTAYPTIGDGVRIYNNSCVIGKITVGDNAVIGAGSVVIKDIPAGEVWAGNPAKKIK